jgi:hypothetical protein
MSGFLGTLLTNEFDAAAAICQLRPVPSQVRLGFICFFVCTAVIGNIRTYLAIDYRGKSKTCYGFPIRANRPKPGASTPISCFLNTYDRLDFMIKTVARRGRPWPTDADALMPRGVAYRTQQPPKAQHPLDFTVQQSKPMSFLGCPLTFAYSFPAPSFDPPWIALGLFAPHRGCSDVTHSLPSQPWQRRSNFSLRRRTPRTPPAASEPSCGEAIRPGSLHPAATPGWTP